MGRKLGIQLGDVIAAAATLADTDGLDSVTLARVAKALDMRSPSLYNHVAGLEGLRRQMSMFAAGELTTALRATTKDSRDPREALRSIAFAYRTFAHGHPGLYASLSPAPDPEEDPELAEAFFGPVAVVGEWLEPPSSDDVNFIHRVRAFRSLLHGFITLELERGFGLPVDIDASFEFAVDQGIDALLG